MKSVNTPSCGPGRRCSGLGDVSNSANCAAILDHHAGTVGERIEALMREFLGFAGETAGRGRPPVDLVSDLLAGDPSVMPDE